MSFSVSATRRRLRVRGHAARRSSPARATSCARASSGWSRDLAALQPRGARAARPPASDGPVAAATSSTTAATRAVRRAADRARRPRPSGRPTRRSCGLPGALPRRVLRQPRHARLPRPAAVAHGRGRLARATSRRSSRRSAARIRLATPVERDRRATTTHVERRRRAAASPSASTRSCIATHSDQALAHARRPQRPRSASCSARSPTSPTRRSCTPTASLLPRRRARLGGWNYHLLDEPRRPHDGHLLHEPPAARSTRRREFCVTLNLHRRIDPEKVIRDDPATPTRSSRRRASPRSAATTRSSGVRPHALLRRLLGLGLPRGRRGARCARALGARSTARRTLRAGGMSAQRVYEGTDPPPPPRRRSSTRSATASAMLYLDLDELPERARRHPLWSARRPALARFRRADYLGDPAPPLDDGGARPGRAQTRRPARRAGPAAHQRCAPRPLLQPGQLLLLLRRRTASTSRRSSPR